MVIIIPLHAQGNKPNTVIEESKNPIISAMVVNWWPTEPDMNGIFSQKLQEITGYKLDVQFVPNSGYQKKTSTVIASGNLPMVMVLLDDKHPVFLQAIREGVFWDLLPYLEEFPNLKALYSDKLLQSAERFGGLYGLPRPRNLVRTGLVYRSDRTDALGLEKPNTVKELDSMLRSLRSVYTPVLAWIGMEPITNLAIWLGGVNQYGIQNGKIVQEQFTQAYQQALDYLQSWYKAGILSDDFLLQNRERLFANAGIGFVSAYLGNNEDTIYYESPIVEASGTLMGISSMDTEIGIKTALAQGLGYYGIVSFTKSEIRDEDTLRTVLKLFDICASEPIENFLNWGIEGIHYEMHGQNKIRNLTRYNQDISAFRQLFVHPVLQIQDTVPSNLKHSNFIAQDLLNSIPYAVQNVCAHLVSPTHMTLGTQLNRILEDAVIQYIIGELDLEGLEKARLQWLQAGGKVVLNEYQQAYDNQQNIH